MVFTDLTEYLYSREIKKFIWKYELIESSTMHWTGQQIGVVVGGGE